MDTVQNLATLQCADGRSFDFFMLW